MKNRIRDMREDHDLEQKEIAQLLGISRQYYSRYEVGQVELPIRHYIALANFYNISIDYLCGASSIPMPLHGNKLPPSVVSKYLRLIEHYRTHPEMQSAVNKLLNLEN